MKCMIIVFAAALTLVGPALAKTWIVAKDGSGDFTEVQPAIDAAQPGDVIVVRDGTYGMAWIKEGITLVGAGAGRTSLQTADFDDVAIAITNLPSGQRATVANLTAEG